MQDMDEVQNGERSIFRMVVILKDDIPKVTFPKFEILKHGILK